MSTSPRGSGRAAATATLLAVAALAVAALAAWLRFDGSAAGAGSVKAVALTAAWAVPGVLVTAARPRSPLGWLALGEAVLFAAAGLGAEWAMRAGPDPGADIAWAVWTTERFSALLAVGVWLILLLLPDGRLPSPRWRPVVALVLAAQAVVVGIFMTARGPAAGPDSDLPPAVAALPNPAGVLPGELGSAVAGLDVVVLQLPLLLCLAAYVTRLRRAGPDERVRVVGVLLAASTFVLLVVLGHTWWPQAAEALDVLAGALLAAELTATVLGRRLAVVAAVVRPVFVWTVLLAVIGGLAVAVTAVLGRFGQDLPPAGIAVVAGGAALAVHPLRTWLAALVDRLLYGDARDPYRALQRLADRTHTAPTLDAVLDGLAASVAASLRVPWCCTETADGAGSWGSRPDGAAEATAELVSGTVRVGSVTVATGPGRRLRADELALLADLGRHGGVAVQAVLLTDALRAGRQRLVVAREEERRRLRRDLHDGVGPTLAGLTMQLAALRPLVATEPDAVADRLDHLQQAARRALDTVRRLSHGLRPPALDELGLVGALQQLAESLGLRARFADAEPPRLPAAVEVAAYLITAEALHNVARHAGTAEVEVALEDDGDDLVLRVRDAGAGLAGNRAAGVGLQAMRERADELGGSVVVAPAPGGGTEVLARLPARVPDEVPA